MRILLCPLTEMALESYVTEASPQEIQETNNKATRSKIALHILVIQKPSLPKIFIFRKQWPFLSSLPHLYMLYIYSLILLFPLSPTLFYDREKWEQIEKIQTLKQEKQRPNSCESPCLRALPQIPIFSCFLFLCNFSYDRRVWNHREFGGFVIAKELLLLFV